MGKTSKKKPAIKFMIRTPMEKRTWLTRTGQGVSVIKEMPTPKENTIHPSKEDEATPDQVSVYWEAYVVDASTSEVIIDYPKLADVDTVSSDVLVNNFVIQELYMDKCSEDNNLDVDQLRGNVDSGVWAISTTIHPATLPAAA